MSAYFVECKWFPSFWEMEKNGTQPKTECHEAVVIWRRDDIARVRMPTLDGSRHRDIASSLLIPECSLPADVTVVMAGGERQEARG